MRDLARGWRDVRGKDGTKLFSNARAVRKSWRMETVLLGLASILALIYGVWFSLAGASWPKSCVKTGSIFVLALVAWLAGGPVALVLGLVLGAVGDFWLSRDGEMAFLFGLLSFALGHIAYVILLLQFDAAAEVTVWTVAMLAFAAGMALYLWPHAGALRGPVLGYVVVIGVMGVLAIGLPEALRWGTIAALVFVVSDAILSIEVFVVPEGAKIRQITSRAVWATYFAAQCLFLLSFAGQILL